MNYQRYCNYIQYGRQACRRYEAPPLCGACLGVYTDSAVQRAGATTHKMQTIRRQAYQGTSNPMAHARFRMTDR
jgi:hypothetical protein